MRKLVLIPLLSLVLLSAYAAAPRAQNQNNDDPQFSPNRAKDDIELRQEREREKRLNKERHQRIQKDTDKLLLLATQLKQYVDKTNENVMSVDVIRKAEEIEKLAHAVQSKMKEDYTPPPSLP